MAYPLIGNYGIAKEDFETKQPSIGGLAVRDYNDIPSNFRSAATLDEVMKQYHIPGIYGIDTRKLVRKIRDFGSCKALLTDAQTSPEEGLKKLAGFEIPKDAVEKVSSKEIRYCAAKQENYLVAAIDCGIKENIIRSLNARGCSVMVYPWNTSYEEIQKQNPDGVFLSNGPGNPKDVKPVLELVRKIRGNFPLFGICLGHQMIGLAYGAGTYKLKFGHRGRKPSGKKLKNRENRNHVPESFLCCRLCQSEKYRSGDDPYQSAGSYSRRELPAEKIMFSASSIIRKALPDLRTAGICLINLYR